MGQQRLTPFLPHQISSARDLSELEAGEGVGVGSGVGRVIMFKMRESNRARRTQTPLSM